MFTGLIEETGKIIRISPGELGTTFTVQAARVLESLKPEDSIAVNGVCLTVTRVDKDSFDCDAVSETLLRTTLSGLKRGFETNLERALKAGDRMGGHFVQGHVDGIGRVRTYEKRGREAALIIQIPPELMKYTVEKGSIAIDGMSLTIAGLQRDSIRLAIIPYTMEHTVIKHYRPGNVVNIEVDILGKYVENMLGQLKNRDASYYKSLGY